MNIFSKLRSLLSSKFQTLDKMHRDKAIEDLEWEVQELKHIFALATIGTFIGLPATPLPVTFALLPDMREEFAIMLAKIETAGNPLSEHFSKLDVT